MYNVKLSLPPEHVLTLNDLQDGDLAIIIDEDFNGELFFKNVMGLHNISANRYWPSDYAIKNAASFGTYSGPLHLKCRKIVSGDILKFS